MYSYLVDTPLKAYGIKQFFYVPIGVYLNLILAMLAYVTLAVMLIMSRACQLITHCSWNNIEVKTEMVAKLLSLHMLLLNCSHLK